MRSTPKTQNKYVFVFLHVFETIYILYIIYIKIQRKSQFQAWYEQVKRELLVTEPQNILARSECCQNIINEVCCYYLGLLMVVC